LAIVGFDGKGSLNWLALVDLSKDPNLISKEEDSKLPSDEKDIIHDLQDQVIIEDDELVKIPKVTRGQVDFSPSNQEPVAATVLEQAVRPPRQEGLTGMDQQVRLASQVGQTGSGLKDKNMLRPEHPVANEGKDRAKHNGKKPKLTFAELLAKYQKDNESKRANRSTKVNHQDCLLSIILGNGIGKERVFI
jgi:hypothetical protein